MWRRLTIRSARRRATSPHTCFRGYFGDVSMSIRWSAYQSDLAARDKYAGAKDVRTRRR